MPKLPNHYQNPATHRGQAAQKKDYSWLKEAEFILDGLFKRELSFQEQNSPLFHTEIHD